MKMNQAKNTLLILSIQVQALIQLDGVNRQWMNPKQEMLRFEWHTLTLFPIISQRHQLLSVMLWRLSLCLHLPTATRE